MPGVGGPVPIEEFVFYLSGFLFILLFYIWNDEFWLEAYNVPDYVAATRIRAPSCRSTRAPLSSLPCS